MSTRVPLILGASSFGEPGIPGAKFTDISQCQEVIDVFRKDHKQTFIDTSRIYGEGTSEEYIGRCDLHVRDGKAIVDTKMHPVRGGGAGPENLRKCMMESIKALGNHKIRIFYMHAPDRKVPFEVTAEVINDLYKEGHFEIFGLSNFAAFEVAEMWTICKERNYVLPTVYQGQYNLIQRGAETELIHALRKYNIRYAAWSPLAGGLLSGNIKAVDAPVEKGSRFDPETMLGKLFRRLFLSGTEFEAVQYLESVIKKHDLTLAEVALRWLQHHSVLTPDDYVIIGGSKIEHMKSNCVDSEKGPLPAEVVEAAETAWVIARARSPPAFSTFD